MGGIHAEPITHNEGVVLTLEKSVADPFLDAHEGPQAFRREAQTSEGAVLEAQFLAGRTLVYGGLMLAGVSPEEAAEVAYNTVPHRSDHDNRSYPDRSLQDMLEERGWLPYLHRDKGELRPQSKPYEIITQGCGLIALAATLQTFFLRRPQTSSSSAVSGGVHRNYIRAVGITPESNQWTVGSLLNSYPMRSLGVEVDSYDPPDSAHEKFSPFVYFTATSSPRHSIASNVLALSRLDDEEALTCRLQVNSHHVITQGGSVKIEPRHNEVQEHLAEIDQTLRLVA